MATDQHQHFDLESVMAEVVRISAMVRAQKIATARLLAHANGTTLQHEKENLTTLEKEFANAIAGDLAEATSRRRGTGYPG